VATPATPYDALGLLRSCFKDSNPILFCEYALLFGTRGEVPHDYFEVPLGLASVHRPGADLTIVAYGRMVHVALGAAEQLSKRGVETEVVDLRTLRPLDVETVVASVRKTHRCLVAEEAWATGGFGAYVAQRVQHEAFDDLDGPVLHIGGADVPAPYARNLEQLSFPTEATLLQAAISEFGL
jgi:pyruvate dehydrogenase E1 component beta subunit